MLSLLAESSSLVEERAEILSTTVLFAFTHEFISVEISFICSDSSLVEFLITLNFFPVSSIRVFCLLVVEGKDSRGASKPSQLESNLAASEFFLPDDAMAEIEKILDFRRFERYVV